MNELCILFLHFGNDAVTQKHLALIRENNPGVPVVPLTFDDGVADAVVVPVKLPKIERTEWRNCDQIIYKWFLSPVRVEAKRYLILESDCLCTMSAREFCAEAWDKPASGARVQRSPAFVPRSWSPKAEVKFCSLSPLCGVLLSHAALAAVSTRAENTLFDTTYCEVRIGTLLAIAGFEAVQSFEGAETFQNGISVTPDRPGIWHPVKTL